MKDILNQLQEAIDENGFVNKAKPFFDKLDIQLSKFGLISRNKKGYEVKGMNPGYDKDLDGTVYKKVYDINYYIGENDIPKGDFEAEVSLRDDEMVFVWLYEDYGTNKLLAKIKNEYEFENAYNDDTIDKIVVSLNKAAEVKGEYESQNTERLG